MGRKLKIEDLKDMGDGSFEKMQEEARKRSGGDTEKAAIMLAEMVMLDFLSSRRNTEATAHRSETESTGVENMKPKFLNINRSERKSRLFKSSVTHRKKKEWIGTVPKCFSISHTKKKVYKEAELEEKDSRKLSTTKKRVCSWSDEKENRRTAKKPKSTKRETIEAPPELSDHLKSKIQELNGTDPKLLIQKKIKKTDLKRHQRRFAIPRGELKTTEFLTREEHMIVHRKPDGESIEVTLLDPLLREFKVHFKRWKMGSSFTYNLTSGWLDVLNKNKKKTLRVDDWVQIWCFQRDSKTCLAIVNLTHGVQGQVANTGCDGEETNSGGVSLNTREGHQQGC